MKLWKRRGKIELNYNNDDDDDDYDNDDDDDDIFCPYWNNSNRNIYV